MPTATLDRPVRSARPVPAPPVRPRAAAHRPASRVVVLRRRRVAALVFTVAALFGAVRAVAAFGAGPASGTERRPPVHVVQPGETVWSIAETLAPGADTRSVVRRILKLNGGSAELEVGQRLVLPDGLLPGG